MTARTSHTVVCSGAARRACRGPCIDSEQLIHTRDGIGAELIMAATEPCLLHILNIGLNHSFMMIRTSRLVVRPCYTGRDCGEIARVIFYLSLSPAPCTPTFLLLPVLQGTKCHGARRTRNHATFLNPRNTAKSSRQLIPHPTPSRSRIPSAEVLLVPRPLTSQPPPPCRQAYLNRSLARSASPALFRYYSYCAVSYRTLKRVVRSE